MRNEFVIDIDLYGEKKQVIKIKNQIRHVLKNTNKYGDIKIWKYKNKDIKFNLPSTNFNKPDYKFDNYVNKIKIDKTEWCFAIPNIVIKNNTFNINWLQEINLIYPDTKIYICECSGIDNEENYEVKQYKIYNGQIEII